MDHGESAAAVSAAALQSNDVFVLGSVSSGKGGTKHLVFGASIDGGFACHLCNLRRPALVDVGNSAAYDLKATDLLSQRAIRLKRVPASTVKKDEAYDAHFQALHAHCCEFDAPITQWWRRGEGGTLAPSPRQDVQPQLNVVSLDIEVLPHECGAFPTATSKECPVVTIAVVHTRDVLGKACVSRFIWQLRDLPPQLPRLDEWAGAQDANVFTFADETDMLQEFGMWMQAQQPHIITGWSVYFDLVYLCRRSPAVMRLLGMPGRSCHVTPQERVAIPGCVVIDMLKVVRTVVNVRSRSYALSNIAEQLLGVRKCPMKYSEIRSYFDTVEGRGKLAVYCLKDADLPMRIAEKVQAWNAVLALSAACRLELQLLLDRGQSARVLSVMQAACRHATPMRMVIPPPLPAPPEKQRFRGALVLDATAGLHRHPVVCLDFQALYPSIIMAFNICVSTRRKFAHPEDVARALRLPLCAAKNIMEFAGDGEGDDASAWPPDPYTWHEIDGEHFSKPHHRRGLLPSVLMSLLQRRKAVKREMKKVAEGSDLYNVLDARQKAFKVVMNSFYGTLALEGLPCADVKCAKAVTARGRELLGATQRLAPRRCRVPSEVIYGDTDSVMIKMRCSVSEAVAEGARLARELNERYFPAAVILEYEKCWSQYLIWKRKAYAGILDGKFTASGMELVRTDCASVVTDTQRRAIELALRGDVLRGIRVFGDALEHIRAADPSDLELKRFVKTAELTKPPHEYNSTTPHVEVAKRIPGAARGDKIAFVIANVRPGRPRTSKLAELARHPDEFDPKLDTIHREHYSASVVSALEPWLRVCTRGDAKLDALLDAALRRGEGVSWVPESAPLLRMWNIEGPRCTKKARRDADHRHLDDVLA